ncbi:MAG TPA: RNA polymerase sigma factor [bacterium]|nr:RNA polymerase sigma factor [bacterium]
MDAEEEKRAVENSKEDPAAFGPLFDKYYPAIFRYALHRTGNADVAADIAAEAFFKALKNISMFRFMGAPFSSWLYRIAGNEANRYFRKRKYEPASYNAALDEGGFPEPRSDTDVEKELMDAQEAADKNKEFIEAKAAIASLPVNYQEALVLRFMEGKKTSEIARILGKSEGTVKSLISRGIEKLKRHFKAEKAQRFKGESVIHSKDNK